MSEQEWTIQGSLSLQPIEELEHPLMLKDRWHGKKDLGMRINKHLGKSTVYFGDINQIWLKDKAKKFILYCRTQGKSFGTLQQYSQGIRQFAQFLETECVYSFDDITNEGVRQYIIQRYLRHDNPDMMQSYASILPETEKKEINQLHKQKKIVDITGQEVSINHPELDNDIGLQWLRSKMQPKALAMGFCARPQLLKPCPHANACMTCEHLRLDEDDLPALKQHLERNQNLKQESEQKGYIRQLRGIEEDTAKLINLINTLEEKNG